MHLDLDERAGCRVIRVSGELGVRGYPKLRDTLLKCAVEQPSAVIVVVDELSVADQSLLSVFSQVHNRLSDWPGVPLFLVARREAARRMLVDAVVSHFVPVFPSIGDAVRGVATQPRRRHAKITLPRSPEVSRHARQFTTQVCHHWLPDSPILTDALLVVNALVENVVLHTHSEPVLRLELRSRHFSIAVGDRSPVPARLREGAAGQIGGVGLLMVAQVTKAWGCTPALSGGKVVWGVLATGSRVRTAEFVVHPGH
ncbi:STAS domain-containing protein [Amycolatopsis magusensis]|uniref:STAS domain-containing protein n=1 Tax=Amycolatopsis magusensis TaxID=882444 RepID=UPI003C2F694B